MYYSSKYQYQGPDWYESFNKVTSSSMRREGKKKKKNPRAGSGRVRVFQSYLKLEKT
jgi:hypothetical protein